MLRETFNAGIIGIGINMPTEIRTNSYWDNIEFANSPKEKEKLFIGIDERRIYPAEILSSDAETVAAQRAIEDSGLSKDSIDLLMCHSMLQDFVTPGNASLVQHKLGLKNAGAWNLDTCCSSFVTMLISASNLIMMGTFKNILIVTSVIHSRMISPEHYFSPSGIGDGAAAVIVSKVSENRGYINSHCYSDGEYHDAFVMRESLELTKNNYQPSLKFFINEEKIKMVGRNSINHMAEIMNTTMEKSNIKSTDIDFLLTHQPAHWAHDAWREAIGLPPSKSYQSFRKYGNLASTSIPVNLYEARELKKFKDNDTLLMVSSGAGLNFSSIILKWGR